MTASDIDGSPRASLSALLQSLRNHLVPTPLFNALPTTLQIFSHFQLVSERIQAEALRGLKEHDELTQEMEAWGIAEEDQVAMGALRPKEGRKLRRMTQRDNNETMLAFSLAFRKQVSLCGRDATTKDRWLYASVG